MKRLYLALLIPPAGAALFFACGGENGNLPASPPPTPVPPIASSTAPVASTAPAAPEDAGPPAPPPANPPELAVGDPSPDPAAPTPTARITQPAKGQVIAKDKAPDFEVKLDVKNWPTATGAQHVHLILDNKPYKAIYDPKKPVKLSELLDGAAIDEGQHVLVAFPSRQNHESVKTQGALFVTEFFIGKKGDPKQDITKPMLIYSRPKGAYKGPQTPRVLVDFQLANDKIADGGDHVHITVTGPGIDSALAADATKFGPPFYLTKLQDGSYTLKLELLDKDGHVLPGPWNSTTRTISIDSKAQPDPMPGMNMGGADAGAGMPH